MSAYGPQTLAFTHDPLNRLTEANYSAGAFYHYSYDPVGNRLSETTLAGTRNFTYDIANRLSDVDGVSYTWDNNGNLVSDGVKTYAYDSANRLIQVSDQSFVTSLYYNGLGQRLGMDAAGVIAHYVMDGDLPLTAETGGNTTYYLYGLGVIGEKTTAWSYSLPDGTNTPRQIVDPAGDITLSARYTPWGDTLDTYGTGSFAFGYPSCLRASFGGVMDAATGLLYVGNGQYYDPATGRFLTRDAQPGNSNPYVSWDPSGALLAPLGLLALVYGRKRKASKAGMFLALLLVAVSVGMTLAACGSQTPITATTTTTPLVDPVYNDQGTQVGQVVNLNIKQPPHCPP